ncbi:hypothetical protein NAI64_07110 [Oxalobacter sp. OxGP1]|uniref:hypothetical protein n=1 Tax=Oxalobacter paeniformigenes TaxID=2946594 RepID=UPI0022B0599A|nr:hypothetical protein [Oxalobacter paeniformigenes]MCZ4053491.1 hypothetical protein [Oxalobacter paeniformigenes]
MRITRAGRDRQTKRTSTQTHSQQSRENFLAFHFGHLSQYRCLLSSTLIRPVTPNQTTTVKDVTLYCCIAAICLKTLPFRQTCSDNKRYERTFRIAYAMTQEQKPKKTGWMTTFLRALAIFFFIMSIYYFGKAWLS